MKPTDEIERWVKATSFEANPEMDRALWADLLTAHNKPGTAATRRSLLKVVFRSPLTRVAAVVVLATILVLWQRFDVASKAYALSDAIAAVSQARTIHIRTTMYKDRIYEYWYDLERGREYRHHDGTYPKAYNSSDTYREKTTRVRDGQYLMEIDHQKQTVRFEKLLSWEQEFHRLQMADLAVNAAFPDVSQYLNRYTKIGKDTIDGQSYDVWRREWRIPFKSEVRHRYDIWVSPETGEIGRTRRWARQGPSDWLLSEETDKIEINQEPPAGTFATEPPAGYTLENTKETADILRRDFLLRRTRQGSELSVLPCFTLEDGSIVAIWTVVGTTQIDPNRVYAGLTWGGPLPQLPLSLPGLVFAPGAQVYGSVAHWDENAATTMVPAVGRHLICTIKGDRTYEWALYVPQEVTPHHKSRNQNIVAVVKSNEDRPISGSFLMSTPVTPEQFARYVSEAFRELSNDPSIPASVNYGDLLRLARSVRGDKRLYEDFTRQAKSIMDQPAPEAVETVPPDRVP